METHSNGQTSDSEFRLLDCLFAGFSAPSSHAAADSKTSSVVVEHGALDDGGSISQLAESDFCGNDIFFKDLFINNTRGESTVPHPRQMTLPEAVSSSILVGLGHIGQA
jgi:hypothetical protein